MYLSELKKSDIAEIINFEGGSGFQNHAAGIGIKIGLTVKVIHGSEGGRGPFIIKIGDTRIAFGYGMAAKIIVKKNNS